LFHETNQHCTAVLTETHGAVEDDIAFMK